MKQAYTIGFEGSDGSGKETQTKLFAEYLKSTGLTVARVSFPRYQETTGGKALFELLKSERSVAYNFSELDPKPASLFYAADRLESKDFLVNLIEDNDVVIFDRYVESNLLHQGGKFVDSASKLEFASWLINLEYIQNKLPTLDRVVYLDLPPEISRARAEKRASEGGDALDAVELNTNYVEKGYHSGKYFAHELGWDIISCISIDGRELSIQEISELIKAIPMSATRLSERYKNLAK
jgi:dTMP kinase